MPHSTFFISFNINLFLTNFTTKLCIKFYAKRATGNILQNKTGSNLVMTAYKP